jgi:uncharacterized protein (TIGR02996 family)
MPRYELEEDGVTKYWEVEQDGASFTAKWGKVGGSVSQRTTECDSEDDCAEQIEKQIGEREKKGYALVGGKAAKKAVAKKTSTKSAAKAKSSSNAELEAAIAKNPDDLDAYLVYADWLQGQGDPRGELISLHVALEDKPDDKKLTKQANALIAEHADHFYGPFAEEITRKKSKYERVAITVEWRRGFFDTVRLASTETDGRLLDKMWPDFMKLASSRFVRDLRIGVADPEGGDNYYTDFMKAVKKHGAPETLTSLFVGDYEGETEISWSHLDEVHHFWKACPRLEEVTLNAGSMDLGKIVLPEVKSFEIITGGLTTGELESVVAAKWPKLMSLKIYFGQEHYGADCSADDVKPLLAAVVAHRAE